jgi:hypothetical protein
MITLTAVLFHWANAKIEEKNYTFLDFPKINVTDFKQNTMPAKIDNSNEQDYRTYEQRYWINDKYFSIDSKAPIFLYICGE